MEILNVKSKWLVLKASIVLGVVPLLETAVQATDLAFEIARHQIVFSPRFRTVAIVLHCPLMEFL